MPRTQHQKTHKVPARWYKDDPLARGKGLGLVLHQKGQEWIVACVLRGSPGARARVRVGDKLRRLDDYDLKGGDGLEFLRLLRTGAKRTRQLALHRKGKGEVRLPLAPQPMALILNRHHRLAGGFADVAMCRTCRLCLPSISGFAVCGQDLLDPKTGRVCSDPCMIA